MIKQGNWGIFNWVQGFNKTAGLILLALLTLNACDQDDADKKKKAAQAPVEVVQETAVVTREQGQWSEYIAEHSGERISRNDKLRIRFVNDVVEQDKLGQSAAEVFLVEPAIKGKLVFANPREIILSPEQALTPGQLYSVKLKTSGLKGFPSHLAEYAFKVQVLQQSFEVKIEGLQAEPGDSRQRVLEGRLLTADTESPERIEQVLSAHYQGKPMTIRWRHGAEGRHHSFSIEGIVPTRQEDKLTLAWDGAPINVEAKAERVIPVPPLGDFKITRIIAVEEPEQYLRVYFSDVLDASQNHKGLVTLEKISRLSDQPAKPGEKAELNEIIEPLAHSLRVEGNSIMVYAQDSLKGAVQISVAPGIRSMHGERLVNGARRSLSFASQKPEVRFAGKGVILPDNQTLSIPFEAINVHSVQVTALRVYDNNMAQFLQSNQLDGKEEMHRVGRYLWRRTIELKSPSADQWNRYALDATELFKQHPGGMFHLTLSINRSNSDYACGDVPDESIMKEPPALSHDDLNVQETSSWEYAEEYFGAYSHDKWQHRNNPCKDAYYEMADGVSSSRNFMASNIGLLAKSDRLGNMRVVATDLRRAEPMKGVKLSIRNFQNQLMAELETNEQGMAETRLEGVPFYLEAQQGKQKGYLKLSAGSALPTSHFDTGGQKVSQGIKGYIYGERGVWRPGDDIYLTFVLQDKSKVIPASHPATMSLYSPKGQLMQSVTNNTPVGGFYTFKLKTADDALTGNWTARLKLGGSNFSKKLKIETVKPNRLKVELDFASEVLKSSDMPINTELFGQWLHGASAEGLKADVAVRLASQPTRFDRFTDFSFDDPARSLRSEKETVFEGVLDKDGKVNFKLNLPEVNNAPGMLNAFFTSRVFEKGGDFSIAQTRASYHPYQNYVGLKLPKGDAARNMLLTDTDHVVEIGSLDADGQPVSLNRVQVTLYKINWKWWWDKSGDALAQYASASHRNKLQQDIISTDDKGRGKWTFTVKYPDWGRYLVRACDLDGNHCSGKVLYIDWPGWAGRAQEQTGPAASVLTFSSDKASYKVGETAVIQLPEAGEGRALLSVESGSQILQASWLDLKQNQKQGKARFELSITADMAPNVYVAISLIQPHQAKKNDRPIRLYGVIPIKVEDPSTHLSPVLKVAEEWKPEAQASIEVSETNGQAMTYTLAVVDEGLLGLTGYKTPNPHQHFYKKEALGVTSWDLFDQVVGAYGGDLERLLALGGGDEEADEEEQASKKRFPPVVRFLGVFRLEAGKTASHQVDIPQYIGAVRVMLVAGERGAYGKAEQSVFVRQPLSLLVTLPRVLGPDEQLTIPAALFAMDESIKQASLKVIVDDHFELTEGDTFNVTFAKPGDKIINIGMKVKSTLGKGRVSLVASSGEHQSKADVYIDIRGPNPPTVRQWREALMPNELWKETIKPHGLQGTNRVSLEVSAVPPLNLDRRLNYLIRYPHGCVEQVTSSVFPQLYLSSLVKLEKDSAEATENNIHAGIARLRNFQVPSGGFMYWPGAWGHLNDWASSYVGHFLLEAEKRGYHVPAEMKAKWLDHQKAVAEAWVGVDSSTYGQSTPALDQAYRLFTLTLAGEPAIGAMNRLREQGNLPSAASWLLAAAYQMAGMSEAAESLADNAGYDVESYTMPGVTYGSELRDRAVILHALVVLKRMDKARELAEDVADGLASDHWQSTQTVSFALFAMAKYVGLDKEGGAFGFDFAWADKPDESLNSATPVFIKALADFPDAGESIKLNNSSDRKLYAGIVVEGAPAPGDEKSSSEDLDLVVEYTDLQGGRVDVERLVQGTDIVAKVTITNETKRDMDNIALTHIVPSGWEIHNARFEGGSTEAVSSGARQANSWFSPQTNAKLDYQDIRDDRIHTYFSLKGDESKTFTVLFNAAYLGRYYLPGISVEAMYDASKQARIKGQWVEVIKPGG